MVSVTYDRPIVVIRSALDTLAAALDTLTALLAVAALCMSALLSPDPWADWS